MNKKQRDNLLSEWAAAMVLANSTPEEVGEWGFISASGMAVAYSRVFHVLAESETIYREYLAEAMKLATERRDSILTKRREDRERLERENAQRRAAAEYRLKNIGVGGPVHD